MRTPAGCNNFFNFGSVEETKNLGAAPILSENLEKAG